MKKQRAFLKWAGGKYGLVDDIRRVLPDGDKLIEPFAGACSVFLNTNYDRYLLNDINPDLIALYKILKRKPKTFIEDARQLFVTGNNKEQSYYALRAQFNASKDPYERSLLFLYMNRHGYNGLCRYNSSGGFNVPFGRYVKPYFPEQELELFAEKAKKAVFTCESFANSFRRARKGNVIYCDPPYLPLSPTANFTSYATQGFGLDDQQLLAKKAVIAAKQRQIPVVISNHDTEQGRWLYRDAQLTELRVSRFISQNGAKRGKVGELIALFCPDLLSSESKNVVPMRIRAGKAV
ncbi:MULTISPECIES: Dam family site-specific DNA-(adenine-N6)-methyltransferase [Gammaproteobacteria]|uniref:Dam family site-specific DNA-(adenine-N6)-methyltransferase n=1 Tax=Gammaproteobacteria TaxID=1236 RepID=UPI000DD0728E|nr:MULTISPECIES: Dam family site-specific DNA-(adenine-N6)-methyltransferase [Gammaproteobacteria]RTE85922.1 Dam family site-specific DNA-(adenine-N6)-methyltransferase [Aliidiomarina sp. B3213]TCZ90079.1 Dam family site-specific DNA-(adenine-N6)-methyltransferase [Lysobacter sp. N42]